MIAFDEGGGPFFLRVAGVAYDQERVLLHRAERDALWALPGGRVEMGEDASHALVREMHEELGIDVRAGRLLWVVENFFTVEGKAHHELGLYFHMLMARHSPLRLREAFEGCEEFFEVGAPLRLIFQWFPIASLSEVTLYPTFLKRALAAPPRATRYIVHHDEP